MVLFKPSDIPFVLNKFNSFDKNLKFTVDPFQDGTVHFLDLEIPALTFSANRHTPANTHINLKVLYRGHVKQRGLNPFFTALYRFAAIRHC